MKKKNKKRSNYCLVKILGGLLAVLALALAGAGYYFFNMAVVPGKKSFVTNGTVQLTKSTPPVQAEALVQAGDKAALAAAVG